MEILIGIITGGLILILYTLAAGLKAVLDELREINEKLGKKK